MRVLFSTTAGSGHFGPMVPFAKACCDAGHEVKVAAPASFAEAVVAAGFDHAPFADVAPEVLAPIFQGLGTLPPMEANRTVVAEIFGRLAAHASLPGLTETIAGWRPDLVVREFAELGSLIAARKAGVAEVEVAIGLASMADYALPILAGPLAELDSIAGLPEGTGSEALLSGPVVSCVPADIDGEGARDSARIKRFRDASLTAGPGSPPPQWADDDHPLVYVTFGSVAASLPPFAGVYRAVLDALADEPVRVLMTTGNAVEPGALAPLPANARVEQWRPQAGVMPHAAAVVGHGGFGTTMTALAGGVPQVVIPLFAFDQFINAERVAAMGAGVYLENGPDAVSGLAAALAGVLGDPGHKEAALRVAGAMEKLPDMATAPSFLEQLAGR